MKKLLLLLMVTLLWPLSSSAQLIPPARKAAHVQITQGPALELSRDVWAIITWTSNNPGGSDEHFGVVHFGTTPDALNQIAKSHIRLNQGHSETVFRVRVEGLQPHTTYYYKVDSEDSQGSSDGITSRVKTFSTQ